MKIKTGLIILFLFLAGIYSVALAQEELVITTYYPSPYGSYDQLNANQMAVGSTYASTAPGNGKLVVSGNVGIGTSTPSVALEVSGTATATTVNATNYNSGSTPGRDGTITVGSGNNAVTYCFKKGIFTGTSPCP